MKFKEYIGIIIFSMFLLFSCFSNPIDNLLKELDEYTNEKYFLGMIEQMSSDDTTSQIKGMAKFSRCNTVVEELEKYKKDMSVKQLERYLLIINNFKQISKNIMDDPKSKTVIIDPSSPYTGNRPVYSYSFIGPITTKTKDPAPSYTVTVDMIIGYDLNDQQAEIELTSRKYELQDFVKNIFSNKNASELLPEKEEELKKEIRELLNSRFLAVARARAIIFNKFDINKN